VDELTFRDADGITVFYRRWPTWWPSAWQPPSGRGR